MSPNITKRLAIKAELLRHLGTATDMARNNKSSSGISRVIIIDSAIKAVVLRFDLYRLEHSSVEPDLEWWRKVMAK